MAMANHDGKKHDDGREDKSPRMTTHDEGIHGVSSKKAEPATPSHGNLDEKGHGNLTTIEIDSDGEKNDQGICHTKTESDGTDAFQTPPRKTNPLRMLSCDSTLKASPKSTPTTTKSSKDSFDDYSSNTTCTSASERRQLRLGMSGLRRRSPLDPMDDDDDVIVDWGSVVMAHPTAEHDGGTEILTSSSNNAQKRELSQGIERFFAQQDAGSNNKSRRFT